MSIIKNTAEENLYSGSIDKDTLFTIFSTIDTTVEKRFDNILLTLSNLKVGSQSSGVQNQIQIKGIGNTLESTENFSYSVKDESFFVKTKETLFDIQDGVLNIFRKGIKSDSLFNIDKDGNVNIGSFNSDVVLSRGNSTLSETFTLSSKYATISNSTLRIVGETKSELPFIEVKSISDNEIFKVSYDGVTIKDKINISNSLTIGDETDKIGFFGKEPTERIELSSTPSNVEIAQALEKLGLVNLI